MTPRVTRVLGAFSLLLALLTATGWVSSYRWNLAAQWGGGTRRYHVMLRLGRMTWFVERGRAGPLRFFHRPTTPFGNNMADDVPSTLGFGYEAHGWADPNVATTYTTNVPLWFVLALFLIAPGGVLIEKVRRARAARRAGYCPVCGYDLRATPNRCPECGREVAAPAT